MNDPLFRNMSSHAKVRLVLSVNKIVPPSSNHATNPDPNTTVIPYCDTLPYLQDGHAITKIVPFKKGK